MAQSLSYATADPSLPLNGGYQQVPAKPQITGYGAVPPPSAPGPRYHDNDGQSQSAFPSGQAVPHLPPGTSTHNLVSINKDIESGPRNICYVTHS